MVFRPRTSAMLESRSAGHGLPSHIPGKLLIKVKTDALREGSAEAGIRRLSRGVAAAPERLREPLQYLLDNAGLQPDSITPLFTAKEVEGGIRRLSRGPAALAATAREGSAVDDTLRGISLLTLDARKLTPALLKKLRDDDRFEYVEQAPARWLAARRVAATAAVDPLVNSQWGLRAIRWFQATIPDAQAVGVAVLDTGIDLTHPDFQGVSIQYNNYQASKTDRVGHGTHVAGIIGAMPNNQVGIAGVARCQLHAFKVFGDTLEDGEPVFEVEAFNAALAECLTNNSIRVLNLSLGGTESSETERRAFRALHARGKLVVAAMGNEFEDGNPVEYPGAYDGVVAVGAADVVGRRAEFSNTGSHIGLVAPGTGILSLLPTKRDAIRTETNYAAWDGTSMATPHVAAAAALLFARSPQLTWSQARKKLLAGTRRLPTMPKTGHSPEFGSGLLDLSKLLK